MRWWKRRRATRDQISESERRAELSLVRARESERRRADDAAKVHAVAARSAELMRRNHMSESLEALVERGWARQPRGQQ